MVARSDLETTESVLAGAKLGGLSGVSDLRCFFASRQTTVHAPGRLSVGAPRRIFYSRAGFRRAPSSTNPVTYHGLLIEGYGSPRLVYDASLVHLSFFTPLKTIMGFSVVPVSRLSIDSVEDNKQT